MVNLHLGQNWDISWHHGTLVPTEDQYIQMVLNKTSVLPRLCLKFISEIVNLKNAEKSAVIKYIETLGAAFQIQDDIIAVVSEQYAKERGIGEDIREGKRSLMVIHSMNKKDRSSERLNFILNEKTNEEGLLLEAIKIL
jgi:geranylgeranyl pyrophosphate synthase